MKKGDPKPVQGLVPINKRAAKIRLALVVGLVSQFELDFACPLCLAHLTILGPCEAEDNSFVAYCEEHGVFLPKFESFEASQTYLQTQGFALNRLGVHDPIDAPKELTNDILINPEEVN
jgi:hypothetical protein